EEIMLEEVSGMAKFKAVNDNTYRNVYSYKLPYRQAHFRIASLVSQHHRVMHVTRPNGLMTVNELCDIVVSNIGDN
ncbi:MAG: hypothetical protein JXR90_05190, partial [Spirochaetes bacterium]|nr:hypothetical protein [Spirochaetota bacterium]